jgi:hypothetical protein
MARARMLGSLCLLLGACFSPTKVAHDGDDSGSGSGSDGSGTASSASASSSSTQDTAEGGESSSGGCTDACATEGTSCDGDDLVQCTLGRDGCLARQTTPCPSGCADGACQGEPADLAISIIAAVYLQTDLQVTYVVANVGAGASPEFRVDLWADRAGGFDGPPPVGEAGDVGLSKPALAPGDAQLYTDAIPRPPNGAHVAFAVVDPLAAIAEPDETNNVSLGFAWTNDGAMIHTSFGAPLAPLAIPDDGSPLESTIDVATEAAAPEIWCSLNLSHPDVSELLLELVGPDGSVRTLAMASPAGADFGGTTFRDGADAALADASAPFLGEFVPLGPWPGAVPAPVGGWTLRVTDTVPGNTGRMNDWSVSLRQ